MNPDINPFDLPSVLLTEKSQLPSAACIYFAIGENDQIFYIGQSGNLLNRWSCHHRHDQLAEIGNIRISWLYCNDVVLLLETETALIQAFNPVFNRKTKSTKVQKVYSMEPELARKVALEAVYSDSSDSAVVVRALEFYFASKSD